MPGWLSFVAWIILAVVIVAGAVAFLTFGSAWLEPRLKRVNQGLRPVKGTLDCCPPGLGCNDPVVEQRSCRRKGAMKIATAAEMIELEATWSNFMGIKRSDKKKKQQALIEYATVRDGIYARALRENADLIDQNRNLKLPDHLQIGPAKGNVETPRPRTNY